MGPAPLGVLSAEPFSVWVVEMLTTASCKALGDVGDGVRAARRGFGDDQRGAGNEQPDASRHETEAPKAYGLDAALWHRSKLPHRLHDHSSIAAILAEISKG